MREFILLLVGIIVFASLILKQNDKERFVELFQNDNQVRLDNIEQIIFYTPFTMPDGVKNQLKNTDQIKTNLIKNPEIKKQSSVKFEIKNFQDRVSK